MRVPLDLIQPNRLLCSLLLSLLLVSAEDANKEAQKDAKVLLKRVCRNAQVPIESVEEAQQLINEIWEDTENDICLKKYTKSFFDLEKVIAVKGQRSLCDASKFELIKRYHFRYVNPPQDTYKFGDDLKNLKEKIVFKRLDANALARPLQFDEFGQVLLIPIALQQFFKAYVLQISGICKRSMAVNLEMALNWLTEDDHELMSAHPAPSSPETPTAGKALKGGKGRKRIKVLKLRRAKSEGQQEQQQEQQQQRSTSPVLDALVPNSFKYDLNFRQLVYMPELEGELDEGDLRRDQETTLLDLRNMPELNNLMHRCQKRFKPVYSQLVMPIVRLAKLGYEYVGPEIKKYRAALRSEQALKLMGVTMACEAFGKFKLAGAEQEQETIKNLDYRPMLSSAEIEGPMWIRGAEALGKEFARLHGHQATGFQKFLYNLKKGSESVLAALDPHQIAWFRRHMNTAIVALGSLGLVFKISSMANG